MDKLQYILSFAGTALGLFITTATFFAKSLKNAKAKKVADNIAKISTAIIPYIKEAESFINYSGSEKKSYVMTKANQFAIEQGIEFEAEVVSNKIEELIKLTKEVNNKDAITAPVEAVDSPKSNDLDNKVSELSTKVAELFKALNIGGDK